RIWIDNEVRHLAVLSATDRNAFPKTRVRLRVRLMVGDVERVVLVDKHSARPTELLPLFEKFSILIEDLDPIVPTVTNEQTAARIHGQSVGRIELANRGSFLSPGFDEFAVLRKLQNAGVRIPPVSVPDEDIAIRRHEDSGRLIECVRAISSDSSLAERHQDLAVRTEL